MLVDGTEEDGNSEAPKSYRVSMNPVPSIVTLLLGLIMSGHHQGSMTSTIVHKQWGSLLVAASLARAATYVVFFLSPPTSFLPSRPPSELVTSFCLISGGLIFMGSVSFYPVSSLSSFSFFRSSRPC